MNVGMIYGMKAYDVYVDLQIDVHFKMNDVDLVKFQSINQNCSFKVVNQIGLKICEKPIIELVLHIDYMWEARQSCCTPMCTMASSRECLSKDQTSGQCNVGNLKMHKNC
jgi:hypothetical protein